MKNSNDTIRNGNRDLLNCSAVPRSTAPPHAPLELSNGCVSSIKGHHVYKCAVSLLLPHEEFKLCAVMDTIIYSAWHWNVCHITCISLHRIYSCFLWLCHEASVNWGSFSCFSSTLMVMDLTPHLHTTALGSTSLMSTMESHCNRKMQSKYIRRHLHNCKEGMVHTYSFI